MINNNKKYKCNNKLKILKSNMNSVEIDSLIDFLNSIDFPVLLGIFGFIFVVIIWGMIKNY